MKSNLFENIEHQRQVLRQIILKLLIYTGIFLTFIFLALVLKDTSIFSNHVYLFGFAPTKAIIISTISFFTIVTITFSYHLVTVKNFKPYTQSSLTMDREMLIKGVLNGLLFTFAIIIPLSILLIGQVSYSSIKTFDTRLFYTVRVADIQRQTSLKGTSLFIDNTYDFPSDEKLESMDNYFVFFYRFDCPYCLEGGPELLKEVGDKENIYFVDISTDEGTVIADRFGIENASYVIHGNKGQTQAIDRIAFDYINPNTKLTTITANHALISRIKEFSK